MKDKFLNRNGIRLAQAATGMSPADFPLGSLESRAAARAILDRAERFKPHMWQHDHDAMQIVSYSHMFLRGPKAEHIVSKVRSTPIYQCGEQLKRYGEPIESDKNPDDRLAELLDFLLQGSGLELPPKDSKLRKPVVELLGHYVGFYLFRQAWERQLPEMPFPIRVENNGPIYNVRVFFLQPSGEWKEETESSMILGPAQELTELMEEEANG